jgi:N-acetylated-alpha-linked acidic dipeptidase
MKAPVLLVFLLVGSSLVFSAAGDRLRGFDPVSQVKELKWEQEARAIPDPGRIRRAMERLSAQPHLAGTPQSKQTAEYLLEQLREFGLEAHIEQYEAMLPQPKSRELEMTAPVVFRAKLEEPAVSGDKSTSSPGMMPGFNAYSGDGDVTASLVYVNYGVPADYDTLKTRGIDVNGKIVIARYGGSWRGIKPKVAFEHGAVGCIIYSDPKDDGFYQGDTYPRGAFRPAEGVQRGSVMDMVLYPGDPLSPGWASEAGSKRLPIGEAATLMKIPVLPISWADAQPLLSNLDGPVAPEGWRGALPFTYHMGGSAVKVHLKVSMDNSTRPLYDVIASIPGSEYPDQWILFGNHHDAWVHGASDPLSGATAQLETARALAELTRKGWKPKRTVKVAFWDGEEYGLVGSTEYMEKHAEELSRKLVAYINSDSNGAGRLGVDGSHTLEAFMQEVVRDVPDPDGKKSLLDAYRASGDKGGTREFKLGPLGSGSDYTPFLQHLGIASLNLRFEGEDAGVYHSVYDDFAWYTKFSDGTFVHGRALAQLTATAVIRLADAPLLPFEFGRFRHTVSGYLDEIEKLSQSLSQSKMKVELAPVRAELLRLGKTSADLEAAWGRALAKPGKKTNLAAVNQILYRSERDLTLDPGLPGRPWFRHRIYAPGKYTGYAVKTLPGIREAVELDKPAEAIEQTKQVVQVLRALSDQLAKATRLLGEN